MIEGRVYLERGAKVLILTQWRALSNAANDNGTEVVTEGRALSIIGSPESVGANRKSGPRNVLIRREDGSLVVRPFRGLRKRPQNRVWYCTTCGWMTLALPSGEVRCLKCNKLGLRGSEARPMEIACPFDGCDWSGWDDGGINDDLGKHLRSCHRRESEGMGNGN